MFQVNTKSSHLKAAAPFTYIQQFSSVSGVHQEFSPEGPQADPHGREAVQLLLGGLWLEVRQVGRADPPPQEAHRHEALQVLPLPTNFCKKWSSLSTHETSHDDDGMTLIYFIPCCKIYICIVLNLFKYLLFVHRVASDKHSNWVKHSDDSSWKICTS